MAQKAVKEEADMINLIDNLFAGWAPHDIMWYSFCIMAVLILLCWAVIAGIRNKHRRNVYRREYARSGRNYDLPLEDEDNDQLHL